MPLYEVCVTITECPKLHNAYLQRTAKHLVETSGTSCVLRATWLYGSTLKPTVPPLPSVLSLTAKWTKKMKGPLD